MMIKKGILIRDHEFWGISDGNHGGIERWHGIERVGYIEKDHGIEKAGYINDGRHA